MHKIIDKVFENIRSQGKKLTETRKSIIEMLVSSHALMTAPDVLEKLESMGISINKTSVYRELDFLVQNKIIKEVAINSGIVHYESALHPHHHHITCKSCGEIKDIDTNELDLSMQQLEIRIKSEGFDVSEHSLEFYGLCAKCK